MVGPRGDAPAGFDSPPGVGMCCSMKRIAIVYGTTEGQTARIAQHLGAFARAQGYGADVLHAAELPDEFDLEDYDGVIVGASIHEGRHQRYVVRGVKQHKAALSRIPSAWFSVCLAIHSVNTKERAEAAAFPRQMAEKTGWKPDASAVFAGALMYTKYSWLKRMVLKQIARKEGGSTDTSRDHEYTDWAQVDRFADALLDRVDRPEKKRASAPARPGRRRAASAVAG